MNNPFKQRHIIHLDMDAFYASVEMLDNPEFRGKPVIVGGSFSRGVVSAASYEARKYGVHSALAMAIAKRRCPGGIFLPVRMQRYKEISDQVFAIFHRFTPLVEPLSLDEAFLDVSGSIRLLGTSEQIAKEIKKLIQRETGITGSAGVASCKLIAKIASDYRKPDGLTIVPHGCEQEFLAPLTIDKLWGVGKSTREALFLLGVKTIGDLAGLPLQLLTAKFGKHGIHLHQEAHGIDDREVIPEQAAKSVGQEETFAIDLTDPGIIKVELLRLAGKVGKRLRRYGIKGRTITLKIKYHDFKQITRSITLASPTDDDRLIFSEAKELMVKTDIGQRPVRLVGITVGNLQAGDSGIQMELFNGQGCNRKRTLINKALDNINDRYGSRAIRPATLLKTEEHNEDFSDR